MKLNQNPIRTGKVIIILLAVLLLLSVFREEVFPSRTRLMCESAELNRLSNEIMSLNLLNSLYLTPQQKKALLRLAASARADREKTFLLLSRKHSALSRQMKALRKSFETNPVAPEKLSREYINTITGMDVDYHKKVLRLEQLAGLAVKVLTPAQRYIVSSYNPCVLPQANVINPERVGQALSGKEIATLDQLKYAPPDNFSKKKEQVMGEAYERLNRYNTSQRKMKKEMQRIDSVINKVRRLPADRYTMNKEKLAFEMICDRYVYANEREIFDTYGMKEIDEDLLPPPVVWQNDMQVRIKRFILSEEGWSALKSLKN